LLKNTYNIYQEEKMYQLYVSIYPHMTHDTYKTFNEFCGKKCVKVENKKKQNDIEFDVENIMNGFRAEKKR
jgi:hypothetical protein